MVTGIEKFKAYFKNYSSQYVLIGGAACDLIFEAKAGLDLTKQKAIGAKIDSKTIKKHKNDIVRLASILSGYETCELSHTVYRDIETFIKNFKENPVDPKSLRIHGVTTVDVIEVLEKIYLT
ncbi:MAG: hypothetical protein RR614_15640 [Eubacterium sp.]